jgi:hypothetical protein
MSDHLPVCRTPHAFTTDTYSHHPKHWRVFVSSTRSGNHMLAPFCGERWIQTSKTLQPEVLMQFNFTTRKLLGWFQGSGDSERPAGELCIVCETAPTSQQNSARESYKVHHRGGNRESYVGTAHKSPTKVESAFRTDIQSCRAPRPTWQGPCQ